MTARPGKGLTAARLREWIRSVTLHNDVTTSALRDFDDALAEARLLERERLRAGLEPERVWWCGFYGTWSATRYHTNDPTEQHRDDPHCGKAWSYPGTRTDAILDAEPEPEGGGAE